MRVISYEVLGTFYSSWRNPKYQHHLSWDFASFLIISLMQDFSFVHKLNCSGTFLVNKSKHRLCMYSSMCGHVNLIRYFRWALWTYYCSSVCGRTMFRPVYFRDGCFVDVPFQGNIFSSTLGRAYISLVCWSYISRVRRVSSPWAFQPCGGLVQMKIAWRLEIYTTLCT